MVSMHELLYGKVIEDKKFSNKEELTERLKELSSELGLKEKNSRLKIYYSMTYLDANPIDVIEAEIKRKIYDKKLSGQEAYEKITNFFNTFSGDKLNELHLLRRHKSKKDLLYIETEICSEGNPFNHQLIFDVVFK